VSTTRTAKLLATATEIQAAGGHVVVTGVESSSKGILAAAAEDRIQWSLLSKADPAEWLKEVRESTSEEEAKHDAKGDERSEDSHQGTRIEVTVNQYGNQPRTPEACTSEESEESETRPVVVGGPGSVSPKPRVELPVPAAPPSSPAPKKPSSGLRTEQRPPGAASPSVVALTFKELVHNKWRTLGFMAAAAVLALAFPVTRDFERVIRGRGKRPSFALPRGKRAHELSAVINGREQPLGLVGQLSRVRVGRDAANSVVLDAEGVERRHFQLVRRGRRWFMENLSRRSLEANLVSIAAGKTEPVSFPLQVRISDGMSVSFRLRPKASQ